MKTYEQHLRESLYQAITGRDKAQRELEFMVDSIAFRIEEGLNSCMIGPALMIHGTMYRLVHVSYCAGDTRDDNYRNVTFEGYLVAENFVDFHLESEEARVCGAALHRPLTDGEVATLAGMSADEHSAVIAYSKTVPVQELPEMSMNFSMSEIEAYFAKV